MIYLKCVACILFVTFSLMPILSPESRDAPDIKELTRLETVWNEAHLSGNAAAVDSLWSDELVVTMPDMPLMNKEESLAIWKAGNMRFAIYKTSDLRIRVFKDAAVVTGQLERIRNANSQQFEDDWRFTKVYVRRNGRWLVVAWHGSHVGSS